MTMAFQLPFSVFLSFTQEGPSLSGRERRGRIFSSSPLNFHQNFTLWLQFFLLAPQCSSSEVALGTALFF